MCTYFFFCFFLYSPFVLNDDIFIHTLIIFIFAIFFFMFLLLLLTERKLAKIKNDTNILNQLKARHEQCIELLLQEKITLNHETGVDELTIEETENRTRRDIIRFIQPEQPIRLDELHHLVDHDHLESKNNNNNTNNNSDSEQNPLADK